LPKVLTLGEYAVSKPILPTNLNDLHLSKQVALLWDSDRQRLVWANRAAVSALQARSLFEAIDRHFDHDDPAVQQLAQTAKDIRPGETRQAALEFTSLLNPLSLTAVITAHPLSDGRQGVLIVEAADTPALADGGLAAMALQVLPVAAMCVDASGLLVQVNDRAKAMLISKQPLHLSDVFAQDVSVRMLGQLQKQSVVDISAIANTKIGPRDCRMILRRIDHPGMLAVATLEDVTDRRAIETMLEERAVSEKPATASLSKPAAMDQLAISMANSLQAPVPQKDKPAEKAVAVPVEVPPIAPKLPVALQAMVDKSGLPTLVVRDGKILFANGLAQTSFGLLARSDVPAWLLPASASTPHAKPKLLNTDNASGKRIQVEATARMVPWQDGPAQLLTLKKIDDEVAPAQKTDLHEPAEEPKSPRVPVRTLESSTGAIRASLAVADQLPQLRHPPTRHVDKSQHVEPNDELKAILDIASDGIVTLDDHGQILTLSAGAEAIFSRNLADVHGKPLADLLTPDSQKVWQDYLAALQSAGLASVFNDGREINVLLDNGGTVPLFLTLGRLQSPNSSARFCAVVRDITQWKRTEQELRHARDTAEAASQQKSVFLAHLSHELRTPLNAIIGFSEAMHSERFGALSNDKYKDYAADIHTSGKHLMALIDDLLDLSRIESGKLDLNFAAIDLSDLTEHAIRMVRDEAADRHVTIRKSFAANLPRVVADQKSMHQVMLNLISNAIKFTEAGGKVIISAHTNPDGELILTFNDNGIGMSAEQIRDAMQPYKRITTQGRETSGTGLGLPLAKALTEANRARFELTSEPGEGTLVEVTFPTTRVLSA
jgi:PAS domain S-box-containing protein